MLAQRGGDLILTDTDYSRVMQAERFKPLRKFIESHLITSTVFILGYSLLDPDLQSIARSAASLIRRQNPVIAAVADADEKLAFKFASEYNIDVIRYSSKNGHEELRAMISSVVKWLEAPQTGTVDDPKKLLLAQALYVYDATKEANSPIIIVALKSLILAFLDDQPDGFTEKELYESMKIQAGVKPDKALFDAALSECDKEGMLVSDDLSITITSSGSEFVGISKRKYAKLWQNLSEHVQMKVGGVQEVGKILENVLIDLFSERAAEAVGLAIIHNPVETSSSSLFDLIAQRSLGIVDPVHRFRFIDYVIELLRRPNAPQRAIIEHLGRSLFCTSALKLDLDSKELVTSFISGRALIVDSNLLISLLAVWSPKHETIKDLLLSAKENGLLLFTTNCFVHETLANSNWARNFAEEHNNDEEALLAAASGSGIYNGNDFLNGLIIKGNKSGQRQSIHEYLKDCLGTSNSVENLSQRLEEDWGIIFLSTVNAGLKFPTIAG